MSPCQFLHRTSHVIDEARGPSLSPKVSQEEWACRLRLDHWPMDWSRCQQTPQRGPCWQYEENFQTVEEWETWVELQR
jgi:hypothetical protein